MTFVNMVCWRALGSILALKCRISDTIVDGEKYHVRKTNQILLTRKILDGKGKKIS